MSLSQNETINFSTHNYSAFEKIYSYPLYAVNKIALMLPL
ncbi:hypothetical protein CbuK_0353 [Coxiella burnetii CbuK_Q154]|uniref:Uncharacterized protein n=1 Tax=Coxiella burnetii (strain Dugway 5J108-111) TaxID=434922 RepID=A9KDJ1_COXBN|nr:hypothetical protein CBUD_0341 [Coxiella burnetii Dugway 5J108-111]ACJ19653.1 hypothetical protein CbuK_0353 [Coxiella burnetii CbuK_Q154]